MIINFNSYNFLPSPIAAIATDKFSTGMICLSYGFVPNIWATLFTEYAMLSVVAKRHTKTVQNEIHKFSFQRHGTVIGMIMTRRAKSGIKYLWKIEIKVIRKSKVYQIIYFFCHMTTESASKSLISIALRFSITLGWGVRNSHPTWAKKNPRCL